MVQVVGSHITICLSLDTMIYGLKVECVFLTYPHHDWRFNVRIWRGNFDLWNSSRMFPNHFIHTKVGGSLCNADVEALNS